ncbi:hypothetical protein [uncultured Brevundimonas sp.]|uniref:hypothetical protein n=1 Tax=uncultured Brevundimonas sp. TaxID=213418 RepID=UPI00260C226D|nr:hypothetical protein [uncultured Brevundimonas sp.]
MKIVRGIFCAASVALAAILAPLPAAANGFDEQLFKTWLEVRTGGLEASAVYWYSTGEITEFPTGKVLAIVEGFDTARLIPDPDYPGGYIQLSRKVYIYRDPTTKKILTEVNGVALDPILFTYQKIHYRLVGDRLQTISVMGTGDRVSTTGPHEVITARRIGDMVNFTVPVYRDRPLPNGQRLQMFETYDFFVMPETAELEHHEMISFVSSVPTPPALGTGTAYLHQVGWRFSRFEDLPASIRDFVTNEQPLWLAPPRDLEEIKSLQGQ